MRGGGGRGGVRAVRCVSVLRRGGVRALRCVCVRCARLFLQKALFACGVDSLHPAHFCRIGSEKKQIIVPDMWHITMLYGNWFPLRNQMDPS